MTDYFSKFPSIPIMDRQKFAAQVGISMDCLVGQIRRGLIPVKKIGKRSFINLELLRVQVAAAEPARNERGGRRG